jgi:hypothetical protein
MGREAAVKEIFECPKCGARYESPMVGVREVWCPATHAYRGKTQKIEVRMTSIWTINDGTPVPERKA